MIRRIKGLPRPHKVAISVLSVIVGLLSLVPAEPAIASRDQAPPELSTALVGERQPLALALNIEESAVAHTLPITRERLVKVRTGDTLSAIFSRSGLPSSLLHDINQLGGVADELKKIYPGKQLTFTFDADDAFSSLHYPLDNSRTLLINQTANGLQAKIDSEQLELRTEFAQATISTNFWKASADAGLTDSQIMNLAGMFAWDVDFALDIQPNDSFTLLYEQHFKDGILVGNGNILAAEFTNQGKVYRAIRHQDGNYYSPEGRYMRKSFLRAPVNFSHISSNFNPRRLHPVTGQIKAHRGIDYAARTGTPVVAAGGGVVLESGFSPFNGNYVVIRHDNTYITKYLHLHKRMVNKGEKVKQEQQIGTVGATGRVTGPHLHYEFLVNGVHKDPKSIDLPKAAFLSAAELAVFKPKAHLLMAQLTKVSGIMLASN